MSSDSCWHMENLEMKWWIQVVRCWFILVVPFPAVIRWNSFVQTKYSWPSSLQFSAHSEVFDRQQRRGKSAQWSVAISVICRNQVPSIDVDVVIIDVYSVNLSFSLYLLTNERLHLLATQIFYFDISNMTSCNICQCEKEF